MARLYVAEPAFTVTGGMADHRARVPASQIFKFAVLLAKVVAAKTNDATLSAMVGNMAVPVEAGQFDERWITECALDLVAAPGKSLVVAGTRQPVAVQMLVFAMNQAMQAYGDGGCATCFQSPADEFGTLADLKAGVDKGEVTTLVSLTPADPAYDAPGDFRWTDVRARLARVVHLGTRVNRTATEADLHIPGTHFLEAWSDVLDAAGIYSLVQPIILPLYDGTSEVQFLVGLLAHRPPRRRKPPPLPPPRRLPPRPTPGSSPCARHSPR